MQGDSSKTMKPGSRSLVMGAAFSGALGILLAALLWAATDDVGPALLGLLAGGALFGGWVYMAHRARVHARRDARA